MHCFVLISVASCLLFLLFQASSRSVQHCGTGVTVKCGVCREGPIFSFFFACLLPINVVKIYVCLFRRQWMPFIVTQPMHKILHLTPSSHLNCLQVNLLLGSIYQVHPNSSFYQAWLIENEMALSVCSLLS